MGREAASQGGHEFAHPGQRVRVPIGFLAQSAAAQGLAIGQKPLGEAREDRDRLIERGRLAQPAHGVAERSQPLDGRVALIGSGRERGKLREHRNEVGVVQQGVAGRLAGRLLHRTPVAEDLVGRLLNVAAAPRTGEVLLREQALQDLFEIATRPFGQGEPQGRFILVGVLRPGQGL